MIQHAGAFGRRMLGWSLAVVLLMSACSSSTAQHRVILDGLNEPRGITLLADGTLCVAEAGHLDDGQTIRLGPTANRSQTGSVSCVDPNGEIRQVVRGLPYVFYNVTGVTTGAADVAEMDGDLYLLTGEGEGELARSLLRVTEPKTPPEPVADFLTFATDTAEPDLFDQTDIFSNPFSLLPDPADNRLLVTDGATGHVLAVYLDGTIEVFSEVPGHEVLTGIARGPDGAPFVTSFSQLPHAVGSGSVLRLGADGSYEQAASDLTTPIDIAFDSEGRMYVLEFISETDSVDPYRGKTGRLVRLDPGSDAWSDQRVVIESIPFPTALLIDGADRIYISIHGAFSPPGSGFVARFDDLATRPPDAGTIRFSADSS